MGELGENLARFLIDYPMLWPLYLLGLWFLIIKPLLDSKEEEKLQKEVLRPIGADYEPHLAGDEDYSFTKGRFSQLVESTKTAWSNGDFDEFAPEARKIAGEPGAVFKMFDSQLNAIAFAFKDHPPEPDEFLVAASDAGVRTSFVVTNKYFYFFGLDKGLLAKKYESAKLAYEAIDRIFTKSSTVFTNIKIDLKSGERIEAKELMSDHASNFINFRLKQMRSDEGGSVTRDAESSHAD